MDRSIFLTTSAISHSILQIQGGLLQIWVFLSHLHSGFVYRYWPLYFLKCPRTFIDVILNPLLCGFYFCFTLLWNESLHIPSITMTNTIAAPEHMVQPKKGLSCRSVSVWITYHTVPIAFSFSNCSCSAFFCPLLPNVLVIPRKRKPHSHYNWPFTYSTPNLDSFYCQRLVI